VAATAAQRGFDAIVLAGGRAARLGGADKPGLVVAGRPILSWVIAAAAAAGARAVVVVGPDRPGLTVPAAGLPRGVAFVAEEPPAAGPVPAVRRGLAETRAPVVALLAADLPFLRAAQLRLLLEAVGGAGQAGGRAATATAASGTPASGTPGGSSPGGDRAGPVGAVAVDDCGRPQWLLGCWHTAALREAAASFAGTSLHGLLGPLRPVLVSYDLGAGEAPPWFDCDTEADLRLARHWTAD
jgi:molybdopterin-guanine dinucleotide biosynthesis protein A